MTLSKRGDYVMRSAICLARAYEQGEGRKIREVVAETDVPRTFASQILADLVRSGLAMSKAGREGGYRLVRPPEAVSVLEVVEAAEGPLRAERCALGAGPCRWDAVCPLHETWTAATGALRELLATTTLAELATRDAAIEAGTYAIPEDAHRSRPLAVEIADHVHVEVAATAVRTVLDAAPRFLATLLADAAAAVPGSATGAGDTEASLAPAPGAGASDGVATYLLECRLSVAGDASQLEATLVVQTVDDERSEVRVEGTWRTVSDASPSLEASTLDRRARTVLRSFLRHLARALEEGPPPARRARTSTSARRARSVTAR